MTWAFSGESGGWLPAPLVCVPFVSAVMSVHSPRGVRAVIAARDLVAGRAADPEEALSFGHDLGDAERLPANSVVPDGVDEIPGADQHQQLAEVDLRDEDLAVAAQDGLGVRRERVEMAKVGVSHGSTVRLELLDRRPDGAIRRAPAEDEQLAAVGAIDLEWLDVRRNPGNLRLAVELHPVVVVRVVADVAGDVRL